jgi:hypothetical protein
MRAAVGCFVPLLFVQLCSPLQHIGQTGINSEMESRARLLSDGNGADSLLLIVKGDLYKPLVLKDARGREYPMFRDGLSLTVCYRDTELEVPYMDYGIAGTDVQAQWTIDDSSDFECTVEIIVIRFAAPGPETCNVSFHGDLLLGADEGPSIFRIGTGCDFWVGSFSVEFLVRPHGDAQINPVALFDILPGVCEQFEHGPLLLLAA